MSPGLGLKVTDFGSKLTLTSHRRQHDGELRRRRPIRLDLAGRSRTSSVPQASMPPTSSGLLDAWLITPTEDETRWCYPKHQRAAPRGEPTIRTMILTDLFTWW